MIQDIDVFDAPVIVGYPPGAGGNRLRRLLLKRPWTIQPNQELHRSYEVRKYTCDIGYPKFPNFSTVEIENPSLSKFPILITHGMHSQVLRRVFPSRKIVKIYCDLHLSLRRHWAVYGQNRARQGINPLPLTDQIRYNLDYYRDNIDFDHDHAVCICPGQGEFAEFMMREFGETVDDDFDQAWQTVISDPNYHGLANMPMIQNAGCSPENLDSGIANA